MKLLILDRDGVINQDSDNFIKSVDEWLPIPGSIEAIARLSRSGFRIYIATNQSGLGRGLFSLQQLEAMHEKLQQLVHDLGGSIEGIYYCPHRPDDNCPCRKPKPGLLLQIAQHAGTSLQSVPVVGDSLRDLEAAIKVDAKPILVMTGKGRNTITTLRNSDPEMLRKIAVYESLAEAAEALLSPTSSGFHGCPSC